MTHRPMYCSDMDELDQHRVGSLILLLTFFSFFVLLFLSFLSFLHFNSFFSFVLSLLLLLLPLNPSNIASLFHFLFLFYYYFDGIQRFKWHWSQFWCNTKWTFFSVATCTCMKESILLLMAPLFNLAILILFLLFSFLSFLI